MESRAHGTFPVDGNSLTLKDVNDRYVGVYGIDQNCRLPSISAVVVDISSSLA